MFEPATLAEIKAFEAYRAKKGLPPIDRKISRKWTASRLNQVNAIDELLKRKGEPFADHGEKPSGRTALTDRELRERLESAIEALDQGNYREAGRLASSVHQSCYKRASK